MVGKRVVMYLNIQRRWLAKRVEDGRTEMLYRLTGIVQDKGPNEVRMV